MGQGQGLGTAGGQDRKTGRRREGLPAQKAFLQGLLPPLPAWPPSPHTYIICYLDFPSLFSLTFSAPKKGPCTPAPLPAHTFLPPACSISSLLLSSLLLLSSPSLFSVAWHAAGLPHSLPSYCLPEKKGLACTCPCLPCARESLRRRTSWGGGGGGGPSGCLMVSGGDLHLRPCHYEGRKKYLEERRKKKRRKVHRLYSPTCLQSLICKAG